MAVLIKDNIMSEICTELSKCHEETMIVSAYCKLALIRQFDLHITAADIKKILLVRFRPEDILSGASDLELYPYCKAHGWRLYFRLDLHAKTYVFDRVRCIIGSANATRSGMSLDQQGNYEMATTCILADKEVRDLRLLLKGSIEMTDSIYECMKQTLHNNIDATEVKDIEWPKEITDLAIPDYSLLFSEDFPSCNSPLSATPEDFLFLNGHPSGDLCDIRDCLETTKCYLWLKNMVMASPNQEMYFGAISAHLHNLLLDEPKPYRKDVKDLLANLLNWISVLHCADLVVDRPNHSQRVRIRN